MCLRSFSSNHIDVEVEELENEVKWRLNGFYGSPYVENKMGSWD